MELEDRLIEIESALANLEKVVDELNEVVIKQAKELDFLKKSNKYITQLVEAEVVKPLSEEMSKLNTIDVEYLKQEKM